MLRFVWGPEPWDLERAMSFEAHVDPEIVPMPPEVECSCVRIDNEGERAEAAACLPGDPNPCTPGLNDDAPYELVRRFVHPVEGSEHWGFPSLVAVDIRRPDMHGWALVIEIDPRGAAPHRARICFVRWTDELGACESRGPVCATRGTLVVNHAVESPEDAQALHGRFEANFLVNPVFPPLWDGDARIEDLVLHGQF